MSQVLLLHGASVNIADLDGVSPLLASIESIGSEGQSMEMEQSQEWLQDMQAVLMSDKDETLVQVDHRTPCFQPTPEQCADMLISVLIFVVSLSYTHVS